MDSLQTVDTYISCTALADVANRPRYYDGKEGVDDDERKVIKACRLES